MKYVEHDPVLIAHYMSKYKSISRVCKELNCGNYQKLARYMRRLLGKNIITRHYVIPIERIVDPCSVVLMRKNQLTKNTCLRRVLRIIAKYISFAGSPIELYYVNNDCDEIHDHIDPRGCIIDLCSKVVKTLATIHGTERHAIEIIEPRSNDHSFDDTDKRIAISLFRISNPPLQKILTEHDVLEQITCGVELPSLRYHYYSHVYRYVFHNYVYRGSGDYMLIIAWTTDISTLHRLLEDMVSFQLMTSYWQIHILAETPLVAVIHGWGFYEKFLEQSSSHTYIENTSYSVYPVIGVEYE